MGVGSSRFGSEGHSRLLDRFAGTVSIAIDDLFWEDLLTFPTQLTTFDPALVQEELSPTCHSLVSNNHATLHFPKLLVHLLRLCASARTEETAISAAINALVLTRCIVLYATEHLLDADLAQMVQVPHDFLAEACHGSTTSLTDEDSSLLHQFVRSVLAVVSSLKSSCSSEEYLLQLEACHLLIALTSTQLYTPHTTSYPGAHPFTEAIMEQTHLASAVVQALLSLYCTRPPLPAKAALYSAPAGGKGNTVVRFVRSAAAHVLWLPYHAFSLLIRFPVASVSPLADTGEVLLLLLVCHMPATGHLPPNTFRAVLQALQDSRDVDDAELGSQLADSPQQAAVPYNLLYEALGRRLSNESSVLLLYLLLHGCRSFQEYALVRSDPDVLLVPLLQQLHTANSSTASHTYILLIIILIFSQDGALAANVHRVTLSAVPWYRDRYIGTTTLGSLMAVVLLQTAQANLAKMQDVYLQTNTLAALANLAPFATNLSSHASQRIVVLLDVFYRRYQRLLQPHHGPAAQGDDDNDIAQEAQMYAEFVRTLLEIINCMLAAGHGPSSNPQLVYSLLHRQEVFAAFKDTAEFQDSLYNIRLVVDFFSNEVEEARHDAGFEWSVEIVLRLISSSARQVNWAACLRPLPDLRFEYVEAETGEDFFVPFVWSLAVASVSLPWRHSAITLFTPAEVFSEEDNLRSNEGAATQEVKVGLDLRHDLQNPSRMHTDRPVCLPDQLAQQV